MYFLWHDLIFDVDVLFICLAPKTPPAFAGQRVKLERARMGDLLKAKIQQRPARQELIRQHILEGNFLIHRFLSDPTSDRDQIQFAYYIKSIFNVCFCHLTLKLRVLLGKGLWFCFDRGVNWDLDLRERDFMGHRLGLFLVSLNTYRAECWVRMI
jgi:hypothetical protein